jgi:mannosyltransferase
MPTPKIEQQEARLPLRNFFYIFAISCGIFFWVSAITRPLWLDELGSYWQAAAGFKEIWPRYISSLSFPTYSYIQWFFAKLIGTSEVALRLPSLMIAFCALWIFYLTARKLFELEIALFATAVFSLNHVIILESIDARPYIFAVFFINLSLYLLVRSRQKMSWATAVLLGFSTAMIIALHYLMALVLPGLMMVYFLLSNANRRDKLSKFAAAAGIFLLAFLLMLPGILYLFHTAHAHVFENTPSLFMLLMACAPVLVPWFTVLVATLWPGEKYRSVWLLLRDHRVLASAAVGLIPMLTLFFVSYLTPLHIFVERHRISAIPGLVLLGACALTAISNKRLRTVVAYALVLGIMVRSSMYFINNYHYYSPKFAIDYINQRLTQENDAVVFCSDYPESNVVQFPAKNFTAMHEFYTLAYYPIHGTVIPMQRTLDARAITMLQNFMQDPAYRAKKFYFASSIYDTSIIDWLLKNIGDRYTARQDGTFDSVLVYEFTPKTN